MKTTSIVFAATLGALALAAIVLIFRTNVDAGSVIGYGSVLALIGMAGLEYRINWKRLLGRYPPVRIVAPTFLIHGHEEKEGL